MDNLGFHCHELDHFEKVIVSNGLQRGEFFNISRKKLPELQREIEKHNLAASIHAPLVKLSWYPNPPTISFLCDIDGEKRQLTMRMIQETMEIARDFGAEYVVVHFPAPSVYTCGLSYAWLRDIVREVIFRLEELSQKYGVPIHIEGFGPSPLLNVDFLTEIITEFTGLQYCFDTGHMHVAAKRDGFDLYQFAQHMAPNIGSIHLWNNRGIDDYVDFHHIPVHPSQKPEDGWVDIERILQLILLQKPSCPIIFESGYSYPEELGGHDFREGVKWVKELVATLS